MTDNAPVVCGTNSGYIMHWRRDEAACDLCRAAHAACERDRIRRQAYAYWAGRAS